MQKDAIVALRHLAYENDASKKRVLDAGGVEAVITAMTVFKDNEAVQRQAASFVSLLAVHSVLLGDLARVRITEKGGVAAIVAALKKWKGDAQMEAAGIKALTSLSTLAEARAALVTAGVPDVLAHMTPSTYVTINDIKKLAALAATP